MSPSLDIAALWRRATQVILERSDRVSPLLDSMRATVPIAMHGNTLVVGLSGAHQYLAGHLQTPANKHRVVEVLREISGKPLDLRLIEGTTAEDWENVQKAQEMQRAKAQGTAKHGAPLVQPQAPGQAAEASDIWGQLNQRLHFAWQSWPHRTLPISKAQFVRDVLPWFVEAEGGAARDGDSEEAIQRGLTKSLDRLAGIADIPATVLALELLRLPKQPVPAARPEKKKK